MGDASSFPKSKPKIMVPPRELLFANVSGPEHSPGPVAQTVSTLLTEQRPFSFSRLLAGAMTSPLTAVQPQPEPDCLSPLFMSPFGMSHQQALAHVMAHAALSQSIKQMETQSQQTSSKAHSPDLITDPKPNPPPSEHEATIICESSHSGRKAVCDKPADDGYKWRKYGQKHVKTSECPRSYYKCTHTSCPVKKKVERGLDGCVLGVTYRAEHNHDPPNPTKQRKDGFALDATNTVQVETKTILENHPEDSDNIDEPIAKRRSFDMVTSLPAASQQTVLEAKKIVLQTRSDVDLLDDGYKWRKYGQKVVKGNPHPRSYYKCTYSGCNVRKHVERASSDPKDVITTYEGKHNHDIPVGRYTNVNAQTQNVDKGVTPIPLQLNERYIEA